MKRYKLLKDLFDHKAGEVLELTHFSNGQFKMLLGGIDLNKIEIDLYTRLGVLEEVDENARWKPKTNEEFWFISWKGDVYQDTWIGLLSEEDCYNFGNCFKTKEEAEVARDRIKSILNEI